MGGTEEICEETSAYVTCYLCVGSTGGTYMCLDGVFSGVLAACVEVCAVRVVVPSSMFCAVGVPCVGSHTKSDN